MITASKIARIAPLFCLFLALPAHAGGDDLILSEAALGPLPLATGTQVSVEYLQELFPAYHIKHGIGAGDSLDFHYFEVSSAGEALFTIIAFIENEAERDAQRVAIDRLTIHSPAIQDQFGIAVGQRLREVLRNRDGDLQFGAAHHENYIGAGRIWYALSMQEYRALEEYRGPVDISPTAISLAEAQRANPEVRAISWPYPRW